MKGLNLSLFQIRIYWLDCLKFRDYRITAGSWEGNLDVERGKGELLQTNHFLQFPPLRAEYLALEKLFNPTLGNWFSSGNMLLFISIAFSCLFPPSPSCCCKRDWGRKSEDNDFQTTQTQQLREMKAAKTTTGTGALTGASSPLTPGPPRSFLIDSTRAKSPAMVSQHFFSTLTITAESQVHNIIISFPLDKYVTWVLTFPDFSAEFLFLPRWFIPARLSTASPLPYPYHRQRNPGRSIYCSFPSSAARIPFLRCF